MSLKIIRPPLIPPFCTTKTGCFSCIQYSVFWVGLEPCRHYCPHYETCKVCNSPLLTSGDVRNDLYLTVERGDFERGGKSVQKNMEVTVYVVYADGEPLQVEQTSDQQ